MLVIDEYFLDRMWFTSDSHFGHANIIEYCNRPFDDVDDMDDALITEWNNNVREEDVVMHLGDLHLGNDAQKYLSQLNGTLSILGNTWHHDKRWIHRPNTTANGKKLYIYSPLVVMELPFMKQVTEKGNLTRVAHSLKITLCHYPLESWEASHHGSLHFHGHTHGNARMIENRLDVGVDCHDYAPISLRSALIQTLGERYANYRNAIR